LSAVREPSAVLLGLLCFAFSFGAAWQAGLAWPAASRRLWARVAAAVGLVLATFGFSLGYWEVLSGIGAAVWGFDAGTIRFLFNVAVLGLPLSALGLVASLLAMLHAAEVPPRAVIPSILAGFAILWLLDPYAVLAGRRMAPVRARYTAVPLSTTKPGESDPRWDLFSSFGGFGDSGDRDGEGLGPATIVLLLIALAVLALVGGVITSALVFAAARKRAKGELARRPATSGPPASAAVVGDPGAGVS
jgi:hypothetical protein